MLFCEKRDQRALFQDAMAAVMLATPPPGLPIIVFPH